MRAMYSPGGVSRILSQDSDQNRHDASIYFGNAPACILTPFLAGGVATTASKHGKTAKRRCQPTRDSFGAEQNLERSNRIIADKNSIKSPQVTPKLAPCPGLQVFLQSPDPQNDPVRPTPSPKGPLAYRFALTGVALRPAKHRQERGYARQGSDTTLSF
ncbi:hypothetical protein BKA64DRAFT_356182 [Cadophora sp. MPI-SDFR-AT-0126]|nr:hypothetical protein BKA64DRAFT_356182 [Leotiomycetes sp. MPI-SDFR-AT-0126]